MGAPETPIAPTSGMACTAAFSDTTTENRAATAEIRRTSTGALFAPAWFAAIRGLTEDFEHSVVSSAQVEAYLAERLGLEAIGPVLVAFAVAMVLLHEAFVRTSTHREA